MPLTTQLFNGSITNSEAILASLRSDVLPQALNILNSESLPVQFPIFREDIIPTNQRNLTDVRTRMGMLLEYELCKAIVTLLPEEVRNEIMLTYVIANKYPDLAFRARNGAMGIRFEIKAIETIAEEKSANFDTLIKDIRQGTDFVVVLVWEWEEESVRQVKWPCVHRIFVMDAYHLAIMRDAYWLNNPPSNTGDGRQGFDLCFGINSSVSGFNREEGNYGKLMRVFDSEYERFLPEQVRSGSTLQTYYEFAKDTIHLGLNKIAQSIGVAFTEEAASIAITSAFYVSITAEKDGQKLLIIGDDGLPKLSNVLPLMREVSASKAILLNGKFNWKAIDVDGAVLAQDRKPATAIEWVKTIS